MTWIDEMFVDMEKERAAESAHRSARTTKVARTVHPKEQIPGAPDAWSALLSSLTNDVNDFNKHKKRAGQTAVRMSHIGLLNARCTCLECMARNWTSS